MLPDEDGLSIVKKLRSALEFLAKLLFHNVKLGMLVQYHYNSVFITLDNNRIAQIFLPPYQSPFTVMPVFSSKYTESGISVP